MSQGGGETIGDDVKAMQGTTTPCGDKCPAQVYYAQYSGRSCRSKRSGTRKTYRCEVANDIMCVYEGDGGFFSRNQYTGKLSSFKMDCKKIKFRSWYEKYSFSE